MKQSIISSLCIILIHGTVLCQQSTNESDGALPKLLAISPYFQNLNMEKVNAFWSKDKTSARSNAKWESIGPLEVISSEGIDYYESGRVKHIDAVNQDLIRFVSASGGLFEARRTNQKWDIKNISSHMVTTTWGGASDTDPLDANHILYGTGDHLYGRGTGLWKTFDGGINWQQIELPDARYFHDIKFGNKGGKIWAGGNKLFSSDDNGETWKTHRIGDFSSVVFDPNRPDTAYISDFAKGIFRTFDGGNTWKKLEIGLPIDDFNRIELAICENYPNVLYAWICNGSNESKGIWKTIDYGATWKECVVLNSEFNPVNNLHLRGGDFHSTVSVSPTDPNKVLIAGWWYAITDDGEIFIGPNSGSHVDYHFATWDAEGKTIYLATDGGLTYMNFDDITIFEDNVPKINKDLIKVPTLQFVSVSTSKGSDFIVGGTQDNGLIFYNSNRSKWFYIGGDGGDVSAHYESDHTFHATLGVFGGSLPFLNIGKYLEAPNSFNYINNGLRPSNEWFRRVGNTYSDNIILFTQSDNTFYFSFNLGYQWIPYDDPDFDVGSINAMVSPNDPNPVVFVSGNGGPSSSIMKVDLTTFESELVSDGLPIIKNITWPQVYISPSTALKNKVYAFMISPYEATIGKKVFVSNINSISWTNITGDLPDVMITSIFVHPLNENFILLGTDGYGIFASEDGGKHWTSYNLDLPKGCMITDFDYQVQDGKLYVLMATYGNGLYRSLLPDSSVGTNDLLLEKNTINVYVENQKARIYLNNPMSEDLKVEIYSSDGKLITSTSNANYISEKCMEIDIPILADGAYVFKVLVGNVSVAATKTVIVQK